MPTASFIGLGIDTARYGHHVCALDQDKRPALKPFHFTENARGYDQLERSLRGLVDRNPGVTLHVRIDAAGQYAENLIAHLHRHDLPLEVSVGQPARNRNYRKAHFDKRKADPVESLACARFAVVERPRAIEPIPPQLSGLRDVVALLEASAKQRTRLVNQLHALMAKAFPELATIATDLSARWVLKLLEKYPTPGRIAAARTGSLLKIPHLDAPKVQRIVAAARTTTGSARGELTESLIRQKVRAILREDQEAIELRKLTEAAWEALPQGGHRRILSIPGIGLQTASALAAKIVSIDRFESASALIGYFAVFPEEVDVSGTDKSGRPKGGTQMRMSRKGNDLVRRLLYTAAQSAARYNPAVKEVFKRQMSRGKSYNVAMGHCMAKLLRLVYGLWKTDRDFDPEHHLGDQASPGEPTEPTESTEPTETTVSVEPVVSTQEEESRGPQEHGRTVFESGHRDRSDHNKPADHSPTPTPTPSGRAPSASPSPRPDTGPAQAEATAGREGRPPCAEPEPKPTAATKKSKRHHARRP